MGIALRVSVIAGPGLVKRVGFGGRSKPVSRTGKSQSDISYFCRDTRTDILCVL
jgi:hypothetical protein